MEYNYCNHTLILNIIISVSSKKHPWASCLGDYSFFGYITYSSNFEVELEKVILDLVHSGSIFLISIQHMFIPHLYSVSFFYEIQMILRLDFNDKWKCDSYRNCSYKRRNNFACDNCICLCWLFSTHPAFPKKTWFLSGICTLPMLGPRAFRKLSPLNSKFKNKPWTMIARLLVFRLQIIQTEPSVYGTQSLWLELSFLLFETKGILIPSLCHVKWTNSIYKQYRDFTWHF